MTVRYVSKATGGDGNSGLTPAQAWATINRATTGPEIQPGDGIAVLPAPAGSPYVEEVICARAGALGRQVSLFSTVARGALIRPPSGAYSAIRLDQSYWDISGFDVSNPGVYTTLNPGGAGVDNTWNGAKSHHISVHDTFIHDCGGNGIGLAWGDWYWMYRNEVARCAATNPYQTSGITVAYQPQDNSGDHSPGWRIVAEGNWSHDNFETSVIPSNHTDGNGIILDDFRNSQSSGHQTVPYLFGALARWNLLTNNGGTGTHAYLSDNVTFLENTLSGNNRDPLNPAQQRAGLMANTSNNARMIGNISIADSAVNSGNFAIGFYQANGCMMDRNLDFDRAKPGVQSILNPSGVAISNEISGLDPKLGPDWMPMLGSPAIGLGAPRWTLAATSLPPDAHAALVSIQAQSAAVLQNYP